MGLAGGLNLYGYAGGDPVNFSDPFGLCRQGTNEPECKSRDEAAKEAMKRIFKKSVKENKEYAGEIVKVGKGKYVYTTARGGTTANASVNTGVPGYDGYYHSHGGPDPRYDSCPGSAGM